MNRKKEGIINIFNSIQAGFYIFYDTSITNIS